MIISYKDKEIDFNNIHSVSVEQDTLIFHSRNDDQLLPLGNDYRGVTEHVADHIATSYRDGANHLNLSTYLSKLEKTA